MSERITNLYRQYINMPMANRIELSRRSYAKMEEEFKKAYIDSVSVEILSNEDTIVSAFDSGAIDALTTSWRSFGELELTSSMFNTFENQQNRFTFVGINCQREIFNTEKLR